MEVISITGIFKNFIKNLASDNAKRIFENICLGKGFSEDGNVIYTYEEYFNELKDILNTSGVGYEYAEVMYIKREPTSMYEYLGSSQDDIGSQKSLTYPIFLSPKYMKKYLDFNSFLFNVAFPFIVLPKVYYSAKYQTMTSAVGAGYYHDDMDHLHELVVEWKDYFIPIFKEFCSYRDYFMEKNVRLVYHGKELVVATNKKLNTAELKKFKINHQNYRFAPFNSIFNYE